MKSIALLVLIGTAPWAYSAQMGPGFGSLYQITDLGSVATVPTPYSSLIFKAGNSNILLLGGASTDPSGEVYSVPVTRNPATNHVTSLGTPAPFLSTPYIDGGLIYAPNGDLLFTEYRTNEIGEIKPGDTSPDKTVPAPFGTAMSVSTGSLQIVPAGFKAAGNLVIDNIDNSEFCATSLSPDNNGTYTVGPCVATVTGSGSTEGIIYLPLGTLGFTGETMLVAEFKAHQVTAYSVDSNGLPIINSGRVFISSLAGAQGAAIDPVTGDFFFSTFASSGINEVFEVAAIPQGPAPTVTAVVNSASSSATLSAGLVANVSGTNFGTDSTKVAVSVGGKAAYVYANNFSATQFTVELPFEAPLGATTLTVTINGTPSAAFPITLAASSPAFMPQTSPAALVDATTSSGAPITLAAPAHPGDALVAYAIGLGATTPPTPTGAVAAGVSNQISPLPTVTVGNVSATVTFAGVKTGLAPGVYEVDFKVPANVQGTEPVVIATGAQSSPGTAQLAVAGVSSVVNNASFAHPGTIAPGSIVSVFANALGNASTNEISLFPSTTSEGVTVTFNGTPAPLFHLLPAPANPAISPQQIDLFVPSELPASGTVNVQLATSSGSYPNYTLNMAPASPGFYRFTDPQTGTQYAIAQFANTTWLALPASTTKNLGLPACTATTNVLTQCGQSAAVGDYLVIYLTGLGLATPNGDPNGTPLPTGQNPPADGSVLYETPTMPAVTIGGVPATVLFSGLAPGFAGEYQIDVQVPSGVTNGDNVPVMITMMGASDTAVISIQPRP